jgi:phosphate transport system protein
VTRETYQRSLEELREDVRGMGSLVHTQFERGLGCLLRNDEEAARAVVDVDARVNDRYLELENRCVELFALQQPVAGDLRFITASFKILTDLERIGDLAVNLARYAREMDHRDPVSSVATDDLDDIGDRVGDLLERSLEAYAAEDSESARRVVAGDDEIDALCRHASETLTRELIEHEATAEDAWGVERLLDDVSRVLLAIRDLERIGDHAVNVAARTVYLVETDPEFIY